VKISHIVDKSGTVKLLHKKKKRGGENDAPHLATAITANARTGHTVQLIS